MQISASQLQAWQSCHRKWWFTRGQQTWDENLPEPPKQATFVGTAAHAVVERWMNADDTGRDPKTGRPVELYPPGWEVVRERGQQPYTLTLAEQEQVKRLIVAAIDEGKLRREPGRRTEREFVREILPATDEYEAVRIKGKIDVDMPGAFQDHKFLKDLKYAASNRKNSSKYLGEDTQVLTYAAVKFIEADEAGINIDKIHAQHNSFCKDPAKPEVRVTGVWVERERAAQHWRHIEVEAQRMRDLKKRRVPISDWRAIKGPCEEGACSAYGGCPFANVCSGIESIDEYRARIQRLNSPTQSQTTAMTSTTDVFAALRASKVGATVAPAPAPGGIPAQTAAQAAQAVQAAPRLPAPPWHDPNCRACAGNTQPGFNSAGDPCRMCDIASAKAGRPSSPQFTVWVDDTGQKRWANPETDGAAPPIGPAVKVTEQAAPAPAQAPTPAPQAAQATEVDNPWASILGEAPAQAAPAPAQATPAPVVTAPAPVVTAPAPVVTAPAQEAQEATSDDGEDEGTDTAQTKGKGGKRGPGRPRKGFRLLIGAVALGGKPEAIEATFAEITGEIAQDAKVATYFDLDPFKRRELFARNAAKIAEKLNGRDLVCAAKTDPDVGALIAALKPLASEVIMGVA